MRRNWHDSVYSQIVNMPDDALVAQNYPASGSYIDVSQYTHFAFLVVLGAIDSATTLQVKQDTSATETASIKNITGATESISATDDDELFMVEVETARMDWANSFRYVTLTLTGPAGGNDYGAIVFFAWNARHEPVTQHSSFPSGNYTGLVG